MKNTPWYLTGGRDKNMLEIAEFDRASADVIVVDDAKRAGAHRGVHEFRVSRARQRCRTSVPTLIAVPRASRACRSSRRGRSSRTQPNSGPPARCLRCPSSRRRTAYVEDLEVIPAAAWLSPYPVGKKGSTGLAVRVDEPRRDGLVLSSSRSRPSSRQIADGDDAIALDADVKARRRPARSRRRRCAAAHDQVEPGGGGTCRHPPRRRSPAQGGRCVASAAILHGTAPRALTGA